jgi:hypothetical protein
MKMNHVLNSESGTALSRISVDRISISKKLLNTRFFALMALVGLGLLFTACGAKAAGCPLPYKTGAAPTIPFVSPHGEEHQDGEDSNRPASIVGLWHLIYTADSASPTGAFPPTPFQFLESFKMWHADGTEFENAFLPPTGGNICYGVWNDLGHGTVKLHHIGLMFDSAGHLANIFTVDEKNTVAPNGKTYSGTFDFKLWLPSFDSVGVGSPLAEVTGTTVGTRITVD